MLLIHGRIENNTGTFPTQSGWMCQAIASHGGTAQLVMLPHESHGYHARESVLHVLAETIDWLDTTWGGSLPTSAVARQEAR